MGILFISHSSLDNDRAVRIRDWLKDNGWDQVFLDVDPEAGIAPGQRWQQELKLAGERCSGVIVLLSPHWAASRWCQTEFLVADQLGKLIFPVLISPTPMGDVTVELTARLQIADISSAESEDAGLARLAIGLRRAGLDPNSFRWPPKNDPHRPIYRGLQSLDEDDAAIFFGRDAPITKGMDAIRRIRNGASERMVVIVGASGSGKSSFLKAGLIARLRRNEDSFLVLPIIRPERAAISGPRGLAASLATVPEEIETIEGVQTGLEQHRALAAERLRRIYRDASIGDPPTVVVAIDQAEELFSLDNAEAPKFLAILASLLNGAHNVIVLATIRSDALPKLQEAPQLAQTAMQLFGLGPLPVGAYKDVIEAPARLAEPAIKVEPALTDRLLEDLAADDALPLLAFTLERLWTRSRAQRTLALSDYLHMGGFQGAILAAVDAAFTAAVQDPTLPNSHTELEKLARAAFIPCLVQLDAAGAEPRRRIEKAEAIPPEARSLVRHLIDQRLLVSSTSATENGNVDTVEIVHEAILRQWPALRGWIAEEREGLGALEGVRAAAAEWHRHSGYQGAQADSWLAHRGMRLDETEALLGRENFRAGLTTDDIDYLVACRARENAEREQDRLENVRSRRLQRTIAVAIAVAAVIVVLAGVGVLRFAVGMRNAAAETLAAQAAKEAGSGEYDRAARYAVASMMRTGSSDHGLQTHVEAELRGALAESNLIAVIYGHQDQVLSASFAPDSRRIVTASRDGTARIWEASTGRELAVLRADTRPIFSAAFSPDGRLIATGSVDGIVRIWDVRAKRQLRAIKSNDDAIASIAFNPSGSELITGSDGGTARIRETNSGRLLIQLQGHEDSISSARFSSDGTRVVTASADKTARLWNAASGQLLSKLEGHTSAVESAEFSHDGTRIVTASDDHTVRVWDADTGRQLLQLLAQQSPVMSACFSPDGKSIATAWRDGAIGIWSSGEGRELALLRGHTDTVNSIAYSKDGRWLVSASDDRTARVWDASPRNHVTQLREGQAPVTSVAISPDGHWVLTGSEDGLVHVWNTGTGEEAKQLPGRQKGIEAVAFSPQGNRILTASDDKTAQIWDSSTGRSVTILRGHEQPIYGAAFSPDGARVATASVDRTARIWDARTGQPQLVLRGHLRGLYGVAFSPDGNRIATASADGTVRVWSADTGQMLMVLSGHQGTATSVAFSPDGRRVASGGIDRTALIWDARSGQVLHVLKGQQDGVLSVGFSRDGMEVVTASKDDSARIWDTGTGSEIAVLRGHAAGLDGATFDSSGKFVATASDDGTARLWNVSSVTAPARRSPVSLLCDSKRGLTTFMPDELRSAPVLNGEKDADACQPFTLWTFIGRALLAAVH